MAAQCEAPAQLAPSPIVELNRAGAVAMADGAHAGLEIADALLAEPARPGYSLVTQRARRVSRTPSSTGRGMCGVRTRSAVRRHELTDRFERHAACYPD